MSFLLCVFFFVVFFGFLPSGTGRCCLLESEAKTADLQLQGEAFPAPCEKMEGFFPHLSGEGC